MPDERQNAEQERPEEFSRFEKLARRLVAVPKREIKEAEGRERDQRHAV